MHNNSSEPRSHFRLPPQIGALFVLTICAAFSPPETRADAIPAFQPNAVGSHDTAITQVKESSRKRFSEVVATYEKFIRSHPEGVDARIELCEFLDHARDDEIGSEDLTEEILDRLLGELRDVFPDDRRAIVYRSTKLASDSAIALLEGYLRRHKGDVEADAAWDVFERLADEYDQQGMPYKALHYGCEAMRINDTLDLTLLVAEQCEKVGEPKTALVYLQKFKDKDSSSWTCRGKGEMFMRLGDREEAVAMFQRALQHEDWSGTVLSLGLSLEKLGKLDEARAAIVKAKTQPYPGEQPAIALFLFDLRHSGADSALHSYNEMRELGFNTDPLARHRIALLLVHPSLPWSVRDIGALLLLLLGFIALALAPGLVVVPVHYAGLLRRIPPPDPTRWTLKHFWWIGSLMLISGAVATLIFGYSEITDEFSSRLSSHAAREEAEMAGQFVMYAALFSLCCLAFVRKKDLLSLWGGQWSKAKSILSGIGWMFAIKFVFGLAVVVYLLCFDREAFAGKRPEFFEPLSGSVLQNLLAVRHALGWLPFVGLVAFVVPVYEEFVFRGIALRSFQRYIPFGWANFTQALLFAVLHFSVVTGGFAFAVGIVGGILRKRSSSLVPSIALHVSNNLVAALVLLAWT